MTMGRRPAGVNDAFRNSFVVKMSDFFAKDEVFEEGRPASAALERVLIVGKR